MLLVITKLRNKQVLRRREKKHSITEKELSFGLTIHSLLKVEISAHRPKIYANKCLISIQWIVINENIDLLGHLKTTPLPLIL